MGDRDKNLNITIPGPVWDVLLRESARTGRGPASLVVEAVRVWEKRLKPAKRVAPWSPSVGPRSQS